jgi:hypothetical protein
MSAISYSFTVSRRIDPEELAGILEERQYLDSFKNGHLDGYSGDSMTERENNIPRSRL